MSRKQFFNQCAAGWDSGYTSTELARVKRLIERCRLGESEKLLEPGCGTGLITGYIARQVPRGTVVAVDLSPEMLRYAKGAGLPKNVSFHLGDVHRFPFNDCFFTGVICFNCFPHFEDQPQVLKEFYRVLVPGGRLFIIHSISREQLNQLHKNAGEQVARDMLPPPESLEKMLSAAEYKLVEVDDGQDFFFMSMSKP